MWNWEQYFGKWITTEALQEILGPFHSSSWKWPDFDPKNWLNASLFQEELSCGKHNIFHEAEISFVMIWNDLKIEMTSHDHQNYFSFMKYIISSDQSGLTSRSWWWRWENSRKYKGFWTIASPRRSVFSTSSSIVSCAIYAFSRPEVTHWWAVPG